MKWAISWPRGWRGKGCENRQAFRSFAVRAPCAHHRKANAPPMARCFAKKRAATGTGNERKARIAKPFTAEGPALGYEREVRSTPLSRAIALPPERERPCAKHFPFARRAPGRARFAERLAGAQAFTCQWGAHGARPAKRLRAQPMAKHFPRFGRRAVAQAARHWQSVKPQAARPMEGQIPAHA